MKHFCGCETMMEGGVVHFTKICDMPPHRGGNAWLAVAEARKRGVKE